MLQATATSHVLDSGVRRAAPETRRSAMAWSVTLRNLCMGTIGICAFTGCAMRVPSDDMHAQVGFSEQGAPEGSYTLYNSRGGLQASGEFRDGQRVGTWTFWDSQGIKVVELTYVRGVKEGPCRMWYGAFADPASAGRKKLEMEFTSDREDGMKRSWWAPGGSLKCETDLSAGVVRRAGCWSESGQELSKEAALDAARDELQADIKYLQTLDDVVSESVRDHSNSRVPADAADRQH